MGLRVERTSMYFQAIWDLGGYRVRNSRPLGVHGEA